MLESADVNTLIAVGGLLLTMAMQLIGFGRIIGQVNQKLSTHDEAHIRHQTRLDEHAVLINDHEKKLAVMEDRVKRDGSCD